MREKVWYITSWEGAQMSDKKPHLVGQNHKKNTKDVYMSRNEKTLEIKKQNMSYASLYKSMHLL